eukprot:jgi/Picsp_1/609/NSC_00606-R1_---NA---
MKSQQSGAASNKENDECSTELERKDGCACNTSNRIIPDEDFINNSNICHNDEEPEYEYYQDDQEMVEVRIKLGDGVTPASRKLGRFMTTALKHRLSENVLVLMYGGITGLDRNVPNAEESLKDLKDAGLRCPTCQVAKLVPVEQFRSCIVLLHYCA